MPSSTTAVRHTQAERRREAEGALLDAAVRLFARKGIEQTSLAEIGEEAGYSRGLVNHHFGSKAVLVERLAARAQSRFVAQLLPSGGGGEIEALVGMARTYLEIAGRDSTTGSRAFLVMWGAALPADAALRPVFVAGDARFRDGVAEVVRAGQSNATIDAAVDPADFAVGLVGLLRGMTAQLLIDPDGVDLSGAADICERFVRSVLASSSSARRPR
jgi:AcrR family transcriptional regulator